MTKIMMVAGEASGDLLGGELLASLRLRFPDLVAFGVGGSHMRASGLQASFDINDLSVVGLIEVLKCFPRLSHIFFSLSRLLALHRPRLLITIDLPDFNFLLAKRAKALGIPIIHYVSPQVWAWRQRRVTKIARLLDHLLVLFPFEPALYAQTNLPVTFVGHPLVDRVALKMEGSGERISRESERSRLGLASGEKLVVLLPGSRRSELQRLLATMVTTCYRVAEQRPGVRFILALANTLSIEEVMAHWPTGINTSKALQPEISIRRGETRSLLAAADAALVASGTATLEAALLGAPMVVIYRVNRLTYLIGKQLIQIPFISLANIVAGYGLVEERIQDDANPEVLSQDIMHLLNDIEAVRTMRIGFDQIRDTLSRPDRQAIDVIAEYL